MLNPLAQRPARGQKIHATMAPKSPVFGRERGLNQGLRKVGIPNRMPEGKVVRPDDPQWLAIPIQEFLVGNLAGK